MKVTIKEIAAICGFSIGTVDRAMHNRKGINPKSRERVLSVAQQLGYRPHLLARSLVTGFTMTIGAVVPNLKNPFFSELVEVIQKKARTAGYHVYMMLSEFDPKEEIDSLDRLRALNVDGITIMPVNRGRSFQAYLNSLSTPIVTIANRVSKQSTWVGIDDRAAVRDATRYVISKGYPRIIFVTQQRDPRTLQSLYCDEQRIHGYKEALHEAGSTYVPCVVTDETMIRMIEETRLRGWERTCIVCSCDAVALEVMSVLKSLGMTIPDAVGVMGFDNLDELKYITPRLTTVASPIQKIGEKAFENLLARIKGESVDSRFLEHMIVEGETV